MTSTISINVKNSIYSELILFPPIICLSSYFKLIISFFEYSDKLYPLVNEIDVELF